MYRNSKEGKELAFSLLELLVVLAIGMLLLSVGTVSFFNVLSELHKSELDEYLRGDLAVIRGKATEEGGHGILKIDADGKGYTAGIDYFPYSNTHTCDQILFRKRFLEHFSTSANTVVVYDTRGHSIDTNDSLINVQLVLSYRGVAYKAITAHALGYNTSAEL